MPTETLTQSKPDQADVIALNEKLTADLQTANDNLKTATESLTAANATIEAQKTQLAEAQKGSETLQQIVSARTKERDDLKAENDALKIKMADFDKAVAAEVAKKGIRATAPETSKTQPDRPLTATEKCLAAKGKL